ncbi:hypothetical protein BMS3Bbin04_01404 [bacterium BMS3Bbin04]|nr:hypothetical protein BMS3Bbin04_01404 [bacterium BMS3Bbin04]
MRTSTFILLLTVLLLSSTIANAQSFGSASGLLQGQHLARVTNLHNAVITDATVTTAWIPFGTHDESLAGERPYAPSRFTAFVYMDTVGVSTGVAPSLVLKAQVALTDTSIVYENLDLTLDLAPEGNPITSVDIGQVLPVPVYGGGYIRFVMTVDEAAIVKLDLWRTH